MSFLLQTIRPANTQIFHSSSYVVGTEANIALQSLANSLPLEIIGYEKQDSKRQNTMKRLL